MTQEQYNLIFLEYNKSLWKCGNAKALEIDFSFMYLVALHIKANSYSNTIAGEFLCPELWWAFKHNVISLKLPVQSLWMSVIHFNIENAHTF